MPWLVRGFSGVLGAYVRVRVRSCVRACVRACVLVRACVRECARACFRCDGMLLFSLRNVIVIAQFQNHHHCSKSDAAARRSSAPTNAPLAASLRVVRDTPQLRAPLDDGR